MENYEATQGLKEYIQHTHTHTPTRWGDNWNGRILSQHILVV